MLDFMVSFQEFRTPFLNKFVELITITAEETVIIAIMCIVFWCISREHGYKLILSVILAAISNSVLKMIFNVDRPWVKDDRIIPIRKETATGSSMPSGHTQTGSSMWFSFSRSYRKKIMIIISYSMMILIAVSRVYLSVHTPQDVIVALFLSIIGVLISHRLVEIALKNNNTLVLGFIALIAGIGLFFFKNETYYKMTGLLIAFPIALFLENRYVRFSVKTKYYKQIIKIVVGIVVVLILKEGLKLVLPELLIYEVVRYFFVGFGAIYIVPLIFTALKLSDKSS